MSVLHLLPPEFVYAIVTNEFISNHNFKCHLRCNINSGEKFKTWLKNFSAWTSTTWILRNSREAGDLTKFAFSRDYLCQHSSYRKVSVNGKDKSCEASLSIRIKYQTKFTRLRDVYVKQGLLAVLKINFKHTHPTNVLERKWRNKETSSTNSFIDGTVAVDDKESEGKRRRKSMAKRMKVMSKLKLEKQKKRNSELTGRRIVDIASFIHQIQEISVHENSSCSFKDMVFVLEIQKGFNSGLKFKCQVCSLEKTLWTDTYLSDAVNKAAVAGMEEVGGGYGRLQLFTTALSIPCMSTGSYSTVKRQLNLTEVDDDAVEVKQEPLENDHEDRKANTKMVIRTWGEKLQALSNISKITEREPEMTNTKPQYVELDPNTPSRPMEPSDLIDEPDPISFITPDMNPPDISEPGPSSRVEPDSSMMELDQAMTCEIYPAHDPPPDTLPKIKIKNEPDDPDLYRQDILSASVVQEMSSFTNESGKQDSSLFQPPALIKDEAVSSEEEL